MILHLFKVDTPSPPTLLSVKQLKEMNKTYIELAYAEISDILEQDKRTLMGVIRVRLDNDFKLGELVKLGERVQSSLSTLRRVEARLSVLRYGYG